MKIIWGMLLLMYPAYAQPDLNKPFIARVTTYQAHEDQWSREYQTSTGAKLEKGVAAVDPRKIPYGSRINIPGVGIVTAKDTGAAVVSRKAAKQLASNFQQYRAPVIDVFDPDGIYGTLPEYIEVTIVK